MADLSLVINEGAIDLSRPCASDLSAKQYHIVKHDTNEKAVISGQNDKSLGVLQNAPDGSTNEATAVVRVQGITKVKLAEAVIFGNFLTPDSNGKAEVCDAADEEYILVALSSGDADDLIASIVARGEVTATDA